MTDELWQVIKTYLQKYYGNNIPDELRKLINERADIKTFDGGAFIAVGNEFDLFVLPEKRGKWRIRSTVTDYLNQMSAKHGKLIVNIQEHNAPSLRLAKHFGFCELARKDGMIRLEK